MKKYIITSIETEPMTEAEACEAGLLRTESYRDLPGYHIRYEDGYESWSPKDVFEKAYKVAENDMRQKILEALSSVLESWVRGGDTDCILAEFEEKLNNV